uniref:RluA family pseudouridine synthase n=1 Tax=Eubacterium cellulosolvens TaxID=29322 RepID=UPI000489FD61|nr:RluA family pseudouridine synthase [[Eubacterium] cellulosolvens]
MREIRIDRAIASQRFDKFLQRYLPEAGSSFLYKQLRKKNITLNDGKAKGSEILSEGDVVRIWFSDETLEKFSGSGKKNGQNPKGDSDVSAPSEDKNSPDGGKGTERSDRIRGQAQEPAQSRKRKRTEALTPEMIVYEDADVILINKPAGILSQKAKPGDISLNEMLQAYLFDKGELTEEMLKFYSPSVVNRIDRNTSGLVLGAKNLAAARELSAMLKGRTLQKYYYALVNGQVRGKEHVRAWLVKDKAKNQVKIFDHPVDGAESIETVYEPVAEAQRCTLLRVELLTGKTHQIRAHLSFIGHSLVGDVKYGQKSMNSVTREHTGLSRQFLHSEKVIFPESDGALKSLSWRCFRAPLPADLQRTLEIFGIRL